MKNVRYMSKVATVACLFLVMVGGGFGKSNLPAANTQTVIAGAAAQELGIYKYEISILDNTIIQLLSDKDSKVGYIVGDRIGSIKHVLIKLANLDEVVDVYVSDRDFYIVVGGQERAHFVSNDDGGVTTITISNLSDIQAQAKVLTTVLADSTLTSIVTQACVSEGRACLPSFALFEPILTPGCIGYAACYYGCVAYGGESGYCSSSCNAIYGCF